MDQSSRQGSRTQVTAHGKLTQIFRYLQALHQLRNPPQTEIRDTDLPIMKTLAERGYVFRQIPGGLGSTGDGWYLRSF